jgi:hypothetical protein
MQLFFQSRWTRRSPGRNQLPDQLQIGRREFEIGEGCRLNPLKVRNIQRLGFTLEDGAIEEMEPDRLGGIFVLDRKEFVIDPDVDSQFFPDFALKSTAQ